MMNVIERNAKLKSLFSLQETSSSEETKIEMIPLSFHQEKGREGLSLLQDKMPMAGFCPQKDDLIAENQDFNYVVFNPMGKRKSSKAILLLHGLNERSWDKYLTWAEDLAVNCEAPVILFPIAFHINRTPGTWAAPRWIMPWAAKRKEEHSGLSNCSFFNAALSTRLSLSPSRFYISGRESVYNIWQFMQEIRDGKHDLFSPECHLDIFAYSVGALLSQVLLIANPDGYFSDSKLFTFCGGSVFENMDGNAKDIMDQEAFQKVKDYYLGNFLDSTIVDDDIERAFKAMLAVNYMREERESFFSKAKDRIKMVLLGKDTVVPTFGARNAVGRGAGASIVEEMDFPYEYHHQMPFPLMQNGIDSSVVNFCFRNVFDKAAAFLM